MILHDVEQGSEPWRALRIGKPCASEFSRIVTSTGEVSKSLPGYALTLAGELFAGKALDAWEGNAWTERGKELEAEALQLYEFSHGVTVQRVGCLTDDAETMLCSPDALVDDDGMAEVKCLKAENHIKAVLYWQKHRKSPSDYIQQTQGQLLISGRRWCDLIFHHPDLPPLVIRQTPIPEVQAALTVQIPVLIKERDTVLAALRKYAEAA